MRFDSVVIFSTADWDNPSWTNKQHTALHLSQRGFKVLYLESFGLRKIAVTSSDASRIWRRLKRFFAGAQKKAEGLWVFSPMLLPVYGRPWLQAVNDWALKAQIRYCLFRLKFKKPIAWTYNPLVSDLISNLGLPFIVYHCVDDLAAAPRMPQERIEAEEKRLLQRANVVFVTSETLLNKIEGRTSALLKYYPNVADYGHFHKARNPDTLVPEDIAKIPGPRIGFIGAISSYKLDFALIARVAELEPSWNWVMIGKTGEGDPDTDPALLQRKNIHLLGPKPYAELPGYLKGMDVVVIPCCLNGYTKSMFPMKFFEYLAAGKVVVTTDLPSLAPYSKYVLKARDAREFAASLKSVLNGERRFVDEMDEVARENTWDARLTRMLGDLDQALSLIP